MVVKIGNNLSVIASPDFLGRGNLIGLHRDCFVAITPRHDEKDMSLIIRRSTMVELEYG
jgi:hypothetical protein